MSEPVLVASNLHKRFSQGGAILHILDGLDLDIHEGESLAVVGASGAGKSTLLHLLGGLDSPSEGRVILCGQEISRLGEGARGRIRGEHLGFVYQFHHLMPDFTALENVAMPLRVLRVPADEATERAAQMLADVGLAERLQHRPAELSGGERQRAALARALVHEPKCVLADEPTGNLDEERAQAVFELLLRLNRERGQALVVVTHDRALAASLDRTLLLTHGKLVAPA